MTYEILLDKFCMERLLIAYYSPLAYPSACERRSAPRVNAPTDAARALLPYAAAPQFLRSPPSAHRQDQRRRGPFI